MKLKLNIWRQGYGATDGAFETYEVDASPDMSFLEMLDVLNDRLESEGKEPVAFDHDCREGICGTCSITVNGVPHGPESATTACQLHMRHFHDGETLVRKGGENIYFWIAKADSDKIFQGFGRMPLNESSD